MLLLRRILTANRWFVQASTGLFYILGCTTMAVFGIAALSPNPVQLKPGIPVWEALVFLGLGITAVCAFAMNLIDQIVTYFLEKRKNKREQ